MERPNAEALDRAFNRGAELRYQTPGFVPDPDIEPPVMEVPAFDVAAFAPAEHARAFHAGEPPAVPAGSNRAPVVPPPPVVIVDDDITMAAAEVLVPPPAPHVVQRRPKPPQSLVALWEEERAAAAGSCNATGTIQPPAADTGRAAPIHVACPCHGANREWTGRRQSVRRPPRAPLSTNQAVEENLNALAAAAELEGSAQ